MTKRIIEVSSEDTYLKFRRRQLVIERDGETVASVPVEDMASLVLDSPRTLITNYCLRELAAASVAVITCDEKHQPVGMLTPLQSHTLQSERHTAQARLSKTRRKSLWKQLVVDKIRQQSQTLKILTEKDGGLSELAKKVRSGDPDNIEAQAARRYWPRLFPSENFRRQRDIQDQNRYLNYGYAILRALTARSLCAAGLNPTLGIHHHNRYNSFCLADDLMEPYRPIIDRQVWELWNDLGGDHPLDKEFKGRVLELVKTRVDIDNESLTFQGALQASATSLALIIMGEGPDKLALP